MRIIFSTYCVVRVIVVVFVLIGMQSCKTKRQLSVVKTDSDELEAVSFESLGVKKVLDEIDNSALTYNSIVANKVSITINNGGKENSFQSSIRILRDSVVEVSVRKFSIPAGKIFLTKDSAYYINNLMKEYIASDYDFLKSLIDFDFNYCIVQGILSNLMCDPNLEDVDKLHKIFSAYSAGNEYVIASLKNRKIRKIEEKDQVQKLDIYLKKYGTENVIYRKYKFGRDSKRLKNISYKDLINNRHLEVEYLDFKKVVNSSEIFPHKILLNYEDDKQDLSISLKISKLSLDVDFSPDIRIPTNYKVGL
ncbi:MAG: DUF4292 domain-containing protein [Bacteroidales bacterium]